MRLTNFRIVIALALTAPALAGCVGVETESTVASMAPVDASTQTSALVAAPTADDDREMAMARDAYHDGDFGLAEKHFQRAVELSSTRAEAWLGLAAAHDRLGRFDLADREYQQVEKRVGRRVELLNNRGMSYLMRGDIVRARKDLAAAAQLAPDDDTVRANQRRLDAKAAAEQ